MSFKKWELFYCLLYISLQHITCQNLDFIQSAHLRPSSISTLQGISVSTSSSVKVTNDEWSIDVRTQQGSDIHIALDNRWGFHPLYPSSLQLYIQGNTSGETYNDDGEILFIFSVQNEYFGEMISIDKRKSSYKECPKSNTNLIQRNIPEMINAIQPDRFHRFCKNSVTTPRRDAIDYWSNVAQIYKLPAEWPMYLTITNDPILNIVSYSWTDSRNEINKVTSQYSSSFITDHGMDMYISGESPNEDFHIFSVDIVYKYTIITESPTDNPTPSPTTDPTASPTNNPSISPTNQPSMSPTRNPTLDPSHPPTHIPSHIPTLYPSSNPSYSPSNMPSDVPSQSPTYSPTELPTRSPTIFGETRHPTMPPTHAPTDTTNAPSRSNNNYILINQTIQIIKRNSTKIILLVNNNESNNNSNSNNKSAQISWLQALIIVLSVFVFFLGWLAFFGFVYFTKYKSKRKHSNSLSHKNNNNNVNMDREMMDNVNCANINMDMDMHNLTINKPSPNYHSESAMVADDSIVKRIPSVNNFNNFNNFNNYMADTMYEGSTHNTNSDGSTSITTNTNTNKISNLPMLNVAAIINNDIHNPLSRNHNNNNNNNNNNINPLNSSWHRQSETEINETSETEVTDETSETDLFMYEPGHGNKGATLDIPMSKIKSVHSLNNLHLQQSLRQQQLIKHQKSVSNHSIQSLGKLIMQQKQVEKKKKYKQSIQSIDI